MEFIRSTWLAAIVSITEINFCLLNEGYLVLIVQQIFELKIVK